MGTPEEALQLQQGSKQGPPKVGAAQAEGWSLIFISRALLH